MSADELPAYIFATVFQLPWHLLLASPWLLVAWLVWRFDYLPKKAAARLAVITSLLAFGLAPIYGFHASMMPAYLLVSSGTVSWGQGVASWAVTWFVFFAIAFVTTKYKARQRGGTI